MAAEGLPVLYTFRRCPYAMRARMALAYAGVAVEQREVALRDKPAALLAASPKGTVPVLVLPDGSVLEQSVDIMFWALGRSDPDGWARVGAPEQVSQWLLHNDVDFKPLLDRYKYATRHPERTLEQHRASALQCLVHPLEQTLGVAGYLFGDRPSVADVALFPFVRQFALVDKAWFDDQPLPGVLAWLRRWTDSPLFVAVMGKLPVWRPSAGP